MAIFAGFFLAKILAYGAKHSSRILDYVAYFVLCCLSGGTVIMWLAHASLTISEQFFRDMLTLFTSGFALTVIFKKRK